LTEAQFEGSKEIVSSVVEQFQEKYGGWVGFPSTPPEGLFSADQMERLRLGKERWKDEPKESLKRYILDEFGEFVEYNESLKQYVMNEFGKLVEYKVPVEDDSPTPEVKPQYVEDYGSDLPISEDETDSPLSDDCTLINLPFQEGNEEEILVLTKNDRVINPNLPVKIPDGWTLDAINAIKAVESRLITAIEQGGISRYFGRGSRKLSLH
jgi:hypothetical protein